MQKELLDNDKWDKVEIQYDEEGWPLTFRPAGSPAGTWPRVPWWHSAPSSLRNSDGKSYVLLYVLLLSIFCV